MGQGQRLLGLRATSTYRDLARLLRGCHPDSGGFLPGVEAGPAAGRLGPDAGRTQVGVVAGGLATAGGDESTAAHRAAVDEVVD